MRRAAPDSHTCPPPGTSRRQLLHTRVKLLCSLALLFLRRQITRHDHRSFIPAPPHTTATSHSALPLLPARLQMLSRVLPSTAVDADAMDTNGLGPEQLAEKSMVRSLASTDSVIHGNPPTACQQALTHHHPRSLQEGRKEVALSIYGYIAQEIDFEIPKLSYDPKSFYQAPSPRFPPWQPPPPSAAPCPCPRPRRASRLTRARRRPTVQWMVLCARRPLDLLGDTGSAASHTSLRHLRYSSELPSHV